MVPGSSPGIGPLRLPVIGPISSGTWWLAIGYTGEGVGPSHLFRKILASLYLGEENQWTDLSTPNWRSRLSYFGRVRAGRRRE